jgi:hypothetical protein
MGLMNEPAILIPALIWPNNKVVFQLVQDGQVFDGQVFDDASRYVAEWDDADSVSFICSSLNPVVQNNRQNKIRHTFDIFDRDEIFDILILEKRIKIHAHHVISSSKELGKCAYYKWHDSFSHNSYNCNVFR